MKKYLIAMASGLGLLCAAAQAGSEQIAIPVPPHPTISPVAPFDGYELPRPTKEAPPLTDPFKLG